MSFQENGAAIEVTNSTISFPCVDCPIGLIGNELEFTLQIVDPSGIVTLDLHLYVESDGEQMAGTATYSLTVPGVGLTCSWEGVVGLARN